jgi:hypothetical protein
MLTCPIDDAKLPLLAKDVLVDAVLPWSAVVDAVRSRLCAPFVRPAPYPEQLPRNATAARTTLGEYIS